MAVYTVLPDPTEQKVPDQASVPKAPAYTVVEDPNEKAQKSKLASVMAGLANGLLFGFGDEVGTYLGNLPKLSEGWDAYQKQNEADLPLMRQAMKRSKEANPWTYGLADTAGELTHAIIGTKALGLATEAPQAATKVGQLGQNLAKWATIGPEATIPQIARAGALQSTALAAPRLYGEGEDGIGNRLENVVKGLPLAALTGTIAAPVLSKLGDGVTNVFSTMANNAEGRAITKLAKSFDESKLPAEDVLNSLKPQMRANATPIADDVLATMRQMRDEGSSIADIAKATGFSPSVVSRRFTRIAEQESPAPLTLLDMADTVGGRGAAQPLLERARAIASIPGEAQSNAFEFALRRQAGQGQRLEEGLQKAFKGGDFGDEVAHLTDRLRTQGKLQYDAAHADAKPFDLKPIIDKWTQQYRGQQNDISREVYKALDLMHMRGNVPTENGLLRTFRPIDDLKSFMGAKDALDNMIATSKNGPVPTPLTARLQALKSEIVDEVARTNPKWKIANDNYAEGKLGQRMLEMGRNSLPRSGQKYDEMLKAFNAAPEAGQALFRVGQKQALLDMIRNKQPTHDLTAQIRTPAAQRFLTAVLGKEAQPLIKQVLDEAAITRNSRFLTEGSRTAPMLAAQKSVLAEEQVVQDLLHLNPTGFLSGMAQRAGQAMSNKSNKIVMDKLLDENRGNVMKTLQQVMAKQARMRQIEQLQAPFGPFAGALYGDALARNSTEQDRKRTAR